MEKVVKVLFKPKSVKCVTGCKQQKIQGVRNCLILLPNSKPGHGLLQSQCRGSGNIRMLGQHFVLLLTIPSHGHGSQSNSRLHPYGPAFQAGRKGPRKKGSLFIRSCLSFGTKILPRGSQKTFPFLWSSPTLLSMGTPRRTETWEEQYPIEQNGMTLTGSRQSWLIPQGCQRTSVPWEQNLGSVGREGMVLWLVHRQVCHKAKFTK